MLVTEYNDLNDEPTKPNKTTKTTSNGTIKSTTDDSVGKSAPINKSTTHETKGSSEFSPLYENVINSLERRQRERFQHEQQQQRNDSPTPMNGATSNNNKNGSDSRGDSIDSLDAEDQPSSHSGPIPAYLLEEARQLRQSKTRLESRKVELEKCNSLLESQLTQFKQYISNSGALDTKTKKRLAKSIVEMERMLDTPQNSTPGSPMKPNGGELAVPRPRKSSVTNGLVDQSEVPSPHTPPTNNSSSTYTPSPLHTAADRVNSAVENLVEAFIETNPDQIVPSNGHKINGTN